MRVRPDGEELLRAARVVIEAAILPHLAEDRRDAVRAIERSLALAENRLSLDEEASAVDLAALEDARTTIRGDVLEALPEERRYDARLVAKAIAVATRQLANGHVTDRREYERLAALLGAPAVADASSREIRCTLVSYNERLGARIRDGKADLGTEQYAGTLEHLEAITQEALSESNPSYPRRAAGPAASNDIAPADSAMPAPPVAAAFAAWSDVPPAFLRAIPIAASAPFPERIDAWQQLSGVVGEAICASSNVALTTQADLVGWFAQRLAANPRVPMVVVESAHQAHDVLLAFADASESFCKLALAPFLRVAPKHAETAGLP